MIFHRLTVRRLWFTTNSIRKIYTAQPDVSPLQIYRNKIDAYEVFLFTMKMNRNK